MKIVDDIKNVYSILLRRRKWFWMSYQKNWLLDPATNKRPKYWRKCGAHIGENVNIGYDVYFDASNAELITIEDDVWIAARCLLLCHKRDLSNYCKNDNINLMPHIHAPIHICKGANIGMGSIIMPGVTIGEGAIIGAGSIVTKDIPAWTIAVGSPARSIRTINDRFENETR